MLDIPKFKNEDKLIKFLVKNKVDLINQKKSSIKKADGLNLEYTTSKSNKKKSAKKNNVGFVVNDKNEISVRIVINTTNILDSHKDVHIPSLWDEDLKSNKRILHVQEHKSNQFDKIISSGEDLNVFTKTYNWKDLGYNIEGKTQALVFDSRVKKSRNKYMFKQYKKKYVENHSVGMQYVKIVLCVNDKEYEKEYEDFKKYSKYIVNKENIGKYFWAVLKAKVLEGSAVPLGSNPITPTISTNIKSKKKSKKQIKKLLIRKWLDV